jgi:TRAP-type mannitol/chloroaromatic compound transport system permease small subunit
MTPPPRSGPASWLSFDGFVSVLNSAATLWIVVLMLVINTDVIGRTAFSAPLPGVPELVSLSIVGIVFLQLGHTLRAGRITRVDTLTALFQRRWPRFNLALQGFYHLCGAGLFAVLLAASWPLFVRAWTGGEYAGVEGYVAYPVWPVRLIIVVGCACAVIQYLIFAAADLAALTGRHSAAVDPGDSAPVA